MDKSGGVAAQNGGCGVQVRVGKNEFLWRVVWWQRLEKVAPMKRSLVGKTFPTAPITTKTTARANDQLPFRMLPTLPPPTPFPPLQLVPLLPPLPPHLLLPPVPPSPRAREISSRQKIHAIGYSAPICNAVAVKNESLLATTTATTITIFSNHLYYHGRPYRVAATAPAERDSDDVERR